MISDELLASIAECDRDDAFKVMVKLAERVGRDGMRDAFLFATREGDTKEERPRFYQVGEFLRMVGDPPPMLVDQLIPEKSLVLLTGKPKAGKSFLGIDIMDSVCQGAPVFGAFAVNRSGPVCYLGMEDGQYEIANRLIFRGVKNTDARQLHVCASRFTLSEVEALAELEAMIASINPVLIVVDTAREALGVKDWNDAAQVTEAVRPLREFARRTCSIVLIAHNRKSDGGDQGDEVAGSNAFTSSVDGWISAWKVEKRENGNRRLHLAITGRGGMRGECITEMDTHTTRFSVVADDDIWNEQAQMKLKKSLPIMEAINAEGGKATVLMIAARLGADEQSTRYQVREAVKAGHIRETDEKKAAGASGGRPSPLYAVVSGSSGVS